MAKSKNHHLIAGKIIPSTELPNGTWLLEKSSKTGMWFMPRHPCSAHLY